MRVDENVSAYATTARSGEVDILVLITAFLSTSCIFLISLVIGLRKYATATANLIRSRTQFHQRSVLIHENYLTLPSFVNNVNEWRKRYEKVKTDFDYILSILLPDVSAANSESGNKSAVLQANTALKTQAEQKFADLKKDHVYCVDEWSDWLTRFIADDPNKNEALQMENRLVQLGKSRCVVHARRQKRRIRDEKYAKKQKMHEKKLRKHGAPPSSSMAPSDSK